MSLLFAVAVENALRRGVEAIIGTPGRIIDHIQRGTLALGNIKYSVCAMLILFILCCATLLLRVAMCLFPCARHVVLDEADRMLDMGFSEDVGAFLINFLVIMILFTFFFLFFFFACF